MAEYKLSFTADEINEKLASQANFAQNDTTAFDYIKNRPFIVEYTTIFNEEYNIEISEGGTCGAVLDETTLLDDLNVDENLLVKLNNTSYMSAAKVINIENIFKIPYIGNPYIYLDAIVKSNGVTVGEVIANEPILSFFNNDTGEPFFICRFPEEPIAFIVEEPGTYRLEISTMKLNGNKEIQTLLQGNYLQNDPKASDYIKNRPFYSSMEELFKGTLISEVIGDVVMPTFLDEGTVFQLTRCTQGSAVNVMWDGVPYSLVYTQYDEATFYFGNEKFMDSNEIEIADGEIPFCFLLDPNNLFGGFITSKAGTYSVEIIGEVVYKFDYKYIDWGEEVPWGNIDPSDVLPSVTTSDNDKVLMVVEGKWQAASIANGDEVSY